MIRQILMWKCKETLYEKNETDIAQKKTRILMKAKSPVIWQHISKYILEIQKMGLNIEYLC